MHSMSTGMGTPLQPNKQAVGNNSPSDKRRKIGCFWIIVGFLRFFRRANTNCAGGPFIDPYAPVGHCRQDRRTIVDPGSWGQPEIAVGGGDSGDFRFFQGKPGQSQMTSIDFSGGLSRCVNSATLSN